MNISPFLTPGRIEGTHMKNVNLCNVPFRAGRVIVRHGKNFNAAIFSDIIKVIIVKLCTMALLIRLYQFIALSVTLTFLKITAVSNNLN